MIRKIKYALFMPNGSRAPDQSSHYPVCNLPQVGLIYRHTIFGRNISLTTLFSRFDGKKVALVGTSPKLKGMGFGQLIDQHDEIIRINCSRAESPDTGFKTTVRFIGATFNMRQWEKLDTNWFPCQHWLKDEIVTTTKNTDIFNALGKNCHFFDSSLPMQCLRILPNITKIEKEELAQVSRPPTSGTVALILFLCNSRPIEMNLFGISTEMGDDLYKKFNNEKIHDYDKSQLDFNHMKRETECWIRQELIASYKNMLKSF